MGAACRAPLYCVGLQVSARPMSVSGRIKNSSLLELCSTIGIPASRLCSFEDRQLLLFHCDSVFVNTIRNTAYFCIDSLRKSLQCCDGDDMTMQSGGTEKHSRAVLYFVRSTLYLRVPPCDTSCAYSTVRVVYPLCVYLYNCTDADVLVTHTSVRVTYEYVCVDSTSTEWQNDR